MKQLKELWSVTKLMFKKEYWNKVNVIEFIAFTSKIAILIPGLLFNYQWWPQYIIAFITSVMLLKTCTVKSWPGVIYFNYVWLIVSAVGVYKHFYPFKF